MTPEDKKREQLKADPEFARFIKVLKVKVPLLSIRNQIRAGGKFDPDDILLFAD